MKKILLALSLMTMALASEAQTTVTNAQNDSLMLVGHQSMTTKVAQLQAYQNANNTSAAQVAASDILQLMRTAMKQERRHIEGIPYANRGTIGQTYVSMESLSYQYSQLAANVGTNGAQLVSKTNAFLQLY